MLVTLWFSSTRVNRPLQFWRTLVYCPTSPILMYFYNSVLDPANWLSPAPSLYNSSMLWSVSTSLLLATVKEESYKSQRAFLLVGWWLLLVGWLLLLPFRAFSSACSSLQWNYPLNSSFTLSYYLANISVCYSIPPTAVSLILSTNEIYPSMLEKSDPIIFTDIVSPSPQNVTLCSSATWRNGIQ